MTPHRDEPPCTPGYALLRIWLWAIGPLVPRAIRHDWSREWLAECDVFLRDGNHCGLRCPALAGYAAGALPDALTVRAFWVLDGARWLLGGAQLLPAQPARYAIAISMLTLPIALSVAMFQGARASVASRTVGVDIVVLVLVGLAAVAALMWAAARAVSCMFTVPDIQSRAGAAARDAAAIVMAASVAVPLIVSGLSRMAPSVVRAGAMTSEAFRGDVVTGLAWAAASWAMWKVTRLSASITPPRDRR